MANHSKYNLVYRLQKWIDTVEGQTFLNYAYSWGASVVILGALFKLTHLPMANIMLFAGMGTEVFVFFISAFDRPFDKTADGREIPTHMSEEYLASGKVTYSRDEQQAAAEQATESEIPSGGSVSGVSPNGPTIVFAGGGAPQQPQGSPVPAGSAAGLDAVSAVSEAGQPSASEAVAVNAPSAVVPNYVPQMSAEEAAALNEAQGNYVEELKELVETLKKVNEQSARLTRDSEEMENLNRTLTGISKVYEMQLKGASQQIGTIDQINDQSRRMAQQIEQLNQIYARMIEAMTVNMHVAAPGASQTASSASPSSPSTQL